MPKVQDKEYVDISKVSIKLISKDIAKNIIETYHYSHRFSSTRYALGIFYKTENKNSFFEGEVDQLIGCMTYGYPVGRLTADSISSKLKPEDVLELTRLFIHDGYGANIESYALSLSFKWLKENDKNIKMLISYSDPGQGHLGIIYRATNWGYQGDRVRLVESFSVQLEKDGEWLHPRTIFSMYGSNSIDIMKKQIGHTFWIRNEARKHRYIYTLANKKEKKEILSNLKHPLLPYSDKDTTPYVVGIKEITV